MFHSSEFGDEVMRFAATLRILVACLLGFGNAHAALADDMPTDRGPALGERVAFSAPLRAQDGNDHDLADLHGASGTALVFNRSLSWCPYCKAQTQDLIANASKLTDLGYSIAVITYDAPDVLKIYAAAQNAPFPLLSDTQSATIKAFGLLNEAYEPGSFAYGIPHPMIVVVGADNTVKAKFAEEGYKVRPALADVVAQLSISK